MTVYRRFKIIAMNYPTSLTHECKNLSLCECVYSNHNLDVFIPHMKGYSKHSYICTYTYMHMCTIAQSSDQETSATDLN